MACASIPLRIGTVKSMSTQVIEGTWREVSLRAAGLKGDARVRLEVIEPGKPGSMIREGMFPGLNSLSEEDFKCAEWHESAEGLY